MSLHLPSISTDRLEVDFCRADGRVKVWIGPDFALLTLTRDEARALANGLQNACVELAMPVEEAA